ncbi:type IV secretory system conjugative DNA transfer family protein (plasmid) [Mycolicibacterium aichiense]|uniref:type IV secretory system conjugative DNA transfer family protein n=1 Tax=Mycolicibacterium aichiense TaxID=1799 RepID=UPI003D67CDBD
MDRRAICLAAFRRSDDRRAAELRAELPLLLGRLAAEVDSATIELQVATGHDGVVAGALAVEAGEVTDELLSEAAALLQPVAEVFALEDTAAGPVSVWPLIASGRAPLGFRTEDRSATRSTAWSTAGTRGVPELVELVSPYVGVGIRIRMRADERRNTGNQLWHVEMAVVCDGAVPSLRLRAAVRALFPGLEVAADPGGSPAVLQVSADELPAAFPVPIAGEEPIPGAYVGTAAPLPLHPARTPAATALSVRIGCAMTVSGKRVPVELGVSERLRHVHVLGRTGTGKSSFLAGLAHHVAKTGDGMLVLDPHGPLVDRIIAEMPASAVDRTWIIRCGDVENPVPVNPLAVPDRRRLEIAIDDVCAVFQYLFDKKESGIVGPRFRERVAMALRALVAVNGNKASILDVPTALHDPKFMMRAAKAASDERLRMWIENDLVNRQSGEYGDLVSWVNSKFEPFTSTEAMRAILGSGEDAVDMTAAMDEGRILLVDLSKSDLGESATRLLGYLYLNETWVGALQRANPARPFTVIVDEAQTMIAGSLSAMLSEGRKFGLSVVLAHQYLGQLAEDLLPAVDGNVATTVAFRSAVADMAAVTQRFGHGVKEATLMTLPDLSAITLRTAAHVTGEPHTLIVDHNERVVARAGQELADFTDALSVATARDLVDKFRGATSAAAEGKSNLKEPDDAGVGPHAAAPPTPTRPRTPPKDRTFLDEWLAKRQRSADQQSVEEPAGGTEEQS